MAAQLLGAPYSQFVDSNGAPLNAGKIYAYAAGTTTPKDTYTDADAGTPNANPVVLDSAGRAVIWLSGSYKIVVKDSAGNTIETVDKIASVAATGDMLASTYDAANIQEQLVGLTSVQTLTNKTITKPNIIGTATNDDAAAGSVGEYISSTLASGSAVSLSSNTAKTITSISLTAGDWDVWGNVVYVQAASTTATVTNTGISTTNNGFDTLSSTPQAYAQFTYSHPAAATTSVNAPPRRYSLASTTTIYLVGDMTFAVSTATAYGFIGARRRR